MRHKRRDDLNHCKQIETAVIGTPLILHWRNVLMFRTPFAAIVFIDLQPLQVTL